MTSIRVVGPVSRPHRELRCAAELDGWCTDDGALDWRETALQCAGVTEEPAGM